MVSQVEFWGWSFESCRVYVLGLCLNLHVDNGCNNLLFIIYFNVFYLYHKVDQFHIQLHHMSVTSTYLAISWELTQLVQINNKLL